MDITNYGEMIEYARLLPTHVDGNLAPHYIRFNDSPFKVIYCDKATPVSVFDATGIRLRRGDRYYLKDFITYRKDGSIRPKGEWDRKLFYRKKWARKGIEVKSVEFSIVGVKRSTTHLRASVLISDIKYIID